MYRRIRDLREDRDMTQAQMEGYWRAASGCIPTTSAAIWTSRRGADPAGGLLRRFGRLPARQDGQSPDEPVKRADGGASAPVRRLSEGLIGWPVGGGVFLRGRPWVKNSREARLARDPAPAHSGLAALWAGQPAPRQRVNAPDVFAQGGNEPRLAVRAFVDARPEVERRGRAGSRGGGSQWRARSARFARPLAVRKRMQ